MLIWSPVSFLNLIGAVAGIVYIVDAARRCARVTVGAEVAVDARGNPDDRARFTYRVGRNSSE